MSEITTVEAITREIQKLTALIDAASTEVSAEVRKQLAFAKLALADAELVAEADPELWPARQESAEFARAKLNEVLQK